MDDNIQGLRAGIDNWLAGKNIRAGEVAAFDKVRAIADACDAAIAQGRLDTLRLALITEGAGNASNIVRGNTIELIVGMQGRGLNVDVLLLALFHGKKAKARLSALAVLKWGKTDNAVLDDILVAAVSDKDAVVYEAAMLAVVYSRKKWLLPHMQAKAAQLKGIARLYQLLDKGYVRNRMPDGSWRLEVLMLAEGVRYADIPDKEMQARGIDAIVAALQINDPARDPTPVELVRESSASDASRDGA
ncbi:MAG TPA: hypothetical protein VIF60_18160 [Burkholderiaceae bacterium]|jgi:hypothetical protein